MQKVLVLLYCCQVVYDAFGICSVLDKGMNFNISHPSKLIYSYIELAKSLLLYIFVIEQNQSYLYICCMKTAALFSSLVLLLYIRYCC